MTEDTKRALEIIAPMAKEFGIHVRADDKFLYCSGQAIGIAYNSTTATILEFVGYMAREIYPKQFCVKRPDGDFGKRITRYWFSASMMKQLREAGGLD